MAGGPVGLVAARLHGRLLAAAAGVALLVIVLAASRTLLPRAQPADARTPAVSGTPAASKSVPSATDRFVAAYAHGDIDTIQRVASPLYLVEWERRGVSLREQADLIQNHQRAPTGEWLFFSFETGFVDPHGFGHYLYAGRPVSAAGSPSASVWRVDADASGRVIWIEMVWLFSDHSLATEALPPDASPDAAPMRLLLPSKATDVVFGVRSTASVEGYYGVGQQGVASEAGQDNVQFYVVDGSGGFRLPAWTYGERIPGRASAREQLLQPDESSVLSDYLASIH